MYRHTSPRHLIALLAALMLLASACGDDGGTTAAGGTDDPPADSQGDGETESDGETEGDLEDVEDMVDDMVDDLEEQQAAEGGGSATLMVGEQEWTFTSVLCAFGEEQIGQEGAEFVLSSVQDGMQMYASIDSFGHSVSLDDIEDFENPSVSLNAFGNITINLDGKNVSAEGDFMDGTSDSFDTIPGTFTATCP